MSSIKRNLSLQTAYQVLSACMPLITAPYLARKLGPSQLGVFSFTTSVVMYFTLFAMLGTVNYGTRSIALTNGDRNKRNEVFSEVFGLQLFATAIAILAYALYYYFFCKDNKLIVLLQGIALISCLVDINWLFFGVENFQITVTRSIVVKIISVGLIMVLINRESDLWKYTLIMHGSTFISNLILFAYLPRYASFTRITINQVKKHLKPNLVLFLPLLAMTVYHTMDKTMLGLLTSYEQSGFYFYSDKIVQIPLLIFNGIGTVMLPRMTSLLTDNKQREANDLFVSTMEGVAAVSIAMAFGIAAVAKEFIPLFYGPGYEACILITILFSPILLIKGYSSIIRTQYLIPMKREKEITKTVAWGSLVNLVLNFILIPNYGALGAAAATVAAELVACGLQFLSLRGMGLGIRRMLIDTVRYILIGMIMAFAVRAGARLRMNCIAKLVVEIIIGISVYGIMCLALWVKTKNRMYDSLVKPLLERFSR